MKLSHQCVLFYKYQREKEKERERAEIMRKFSQLSDPSFKSSNSQKQDLKQYMLRFLIV